MDDIPAVLPSGVVLERYDALHITLTHLAQPHQIKLDPPALVIPGEHVAGNMVSKTVKIVNESLSATNVNWTWPEGDLKLCVHPQSLTVGKNFIHELSSSFYKLLDLILDFLPFSRTFLRNNLKNE